MWKNLRLMLFVGIGMTGAAQYGYSQPAPNWYPNQQGNNNGGYGQQNNRRYTTVTVTNRGQNGYPDQVVQQQVPCGSQYFDGYRQRIAPQC
ncbi:MAG: hypothetical protein PSV46_08420 [Reyranella sp.]|nr:hypothetical protein [Reyranella sp.]